MNQSDLNCALAQTFGVILIGFIFGKFSWIQPSTLSGLGQFIAKVCLPSLVLQQMATLDLSRVNWTFVVGVAIVKSFMFAVLFVFTVCEGIRRPFKGVLATAGIRCIFATQTNDFALGLPIIMALFEKTEYHPLVYVVAPVSLMFLNPIGFLMMELGTRQTRSRSVLSWVLRTLLRVFLDPIVLSGFIGVVINVACDRRLGLAADIFGVFGAAFPACALFLLGNSMSGCDITMFQGMRMLVPLVMVVCKVFVSAVLLQQTILALGGSDELGIVGFLYGMLPPAPSVFIYSRKYNTNPNAIAATLVICTVVFAPVVYLACTLINMRSPDDTHSITWTMNVAVKSCSAVGIVGCVLVLVQSAMLWARLAQKNLEPHYLPMRLIMRHRFVVVLLACAELVYAIANETCHSEGKVEGVTHFMVMAWSRSSVVYWSVVIALDLAVSVRIGRSHRPPLSHWWAHLLGWGMPVATTLGIYFAGTYTDSYSTGQDCSHVFGNLELYVCAVSDFVCLATCLLCMFYVHYSHKAPHPGNEWLLPDEQRLSEEALRENPDQVDPWSEISRERVRRMLYVSYVCLSLVLNLLHSGYMLSGTGGWDNPTALALLFVAAACQFSGGAVLFLVFCTLRSLREMGGEAWRWMNNRLARGLSMSSAPEHPDSLESLIIAPEWAIGSVPVENRGERAPSYQARIYMAPQPAFDSA